MEPRQCQFCRHYWGARYCEAYKEGIPEEVFLGEHDHTEPFPGDGGTRYEPIEQEELPPTP